MSECGAAAAEVGGTPRDERLLHVAKANREMWRRIEDSERVPSRCSWEWLTTQKALARQAVRENPGKMDARLAEVLFSNWTPVVLALGSFVTAFGVSFLGSLTFMGVDKAPLVGCLALGLMSAVIPLIGWWWIPAFVIKSVFGIGNASVKKAIREKEKAQELEEQRKRHEEWKKQQEAKSKGQ